jgi:20S proteasome subunit alpha 3
MTDALRLAIKIMSKTLDTTKLTSEKVEIAVLTRENDKTRIRILGEKEITVLIKEYDEEQAKIEAEKLAKEKALGQFK